jgi:chemotaxis protein CheD
MLQSGTGTRYFDRGFRLEAVRILPGEYHAGGGPLGMTTLLGSCVSTCLWDPLRRIGGMNHFMLPGDGATSASPVPHSARFGVHAMELLINAMLKLGAERRRIVAKVFGGGRVLKGFVSLDVGAANCEFVLDFLATESIPVLARDILDSYARKLHFAPDTGKVLLKKVDPSAVDIVQRQERDYLARIDRAGGGPVEIFSRPA